MKRQHKTLLKYVLCAILILVTLIVADPRELFNAITGADLGLLGIVVVLYVLNLVVKSYRWGILMRSAGEKVPFGTVFNNYVFAQAINNITPGRVVGEATRVYGVNAKTGVRLGTGTASVVTERLMDLTFLTLAAVTGIAVLAPVLMNGVLDQLNIAVAVAAVVNVAIIYVMAKPKILRRISSAVTGIVRRIVPGQMGVRNSEKLAGFLGSFTDAMASSKSHASKKALVGAAILTVIVWTNEIARVCLIMMALGATVNIAAVMVVTSLSALSAVLLIAGSGNIIVSSAVFTSVGVDTGIAAGAGVLSALTSIWLSVPIALLTMLIGDRKAKAEAEYPTDRQ